MTTEEVRNRLKNHNFRFGEHDQLEVQTPALFHISGPQPYADELNARIEGTFYLYISILSPQFNDQRPITEAGFEIVSLVTYMGGRVFWIKPEDDLKE